MRLVDCSNKGCRLETLFENEWGTVCSNGFNEQDAVTLCKAFGFPEGGAAVPNLGGGKGVIWLDDVSCEGAEGDVGDCKHAPWLENSCEHADDVGLCCFGGRPTGKFCLYVFSSISMHSYASHMRAPHASCDVNRPFSPYFLYLYII